MSLYTYAPIHGLEAFGSPFHASEGGCKLSPGVCDIKKPGVC